MALFRSTATFQRMREQAVTELDGLLTYKEAADYLRVGRTIMHGLVNRGEVNVVQIGRCIRFRQEDLEKFVKSRVTRRNRKRTIRKGFGRHLGADNKTRDYETKPILITPCFLWSHPPESNRRPTHYE